MATTPATSTHHWRFFRAGGLDQVKLETADDYRNLEHLDQKLWVALACPVKGLELDEKTLALIDTDNDGRVRAPELINAVQWAEDHLRDLSALKAGSDALPLDQINDQTASGKAILASAKQILINLGKADARVITLADAADTGKIFAQTRFNGDGIILRESTDDPAVQQVIDEIMATQGSDRDRSDRPGISQARLDAFFGELEAFSAWSKQVEDNVSTVLPFGDSTGAAADALAAVQAKVDDYFARCRLAAFDARALPAVNRLEQDYLGMVSKDLSQSAQEVAGFPLARVDPARPLPLQEGLNPAWADAVNQLTQRVVAPIFGSEKTTLTAQEWGHLKVRLEGYRAWQASKPRTNVEGLGLPRARAILGSTARQSILDLIAQDRALEPQANSITNVEKLIRYYRDLAHLLNNFVNFSDFYGRTKPASFQAGTLYMDGRACELCLRVDDPAKHATLAGLAKTYLAYCDCSRTGAGKMSIAAAFTDGDSDNLMVGRNGLFYDRKGRDWDATIIKVIENPISIREAFWAPYKKLVRLVEEQVAKRAAAADAAAEQKLTTAAGTVGAADKPKPAEPKKVDVGTVAALGVAFGAIGSFLVYLIAYVTGILAQPFWVVCLVLAGVFLLISGPSMLIAWLKLRQRNVAPILDASGWAVNGRVRMNVPFGRLLTSVAKLPAGAQPAADDPYGQVPPAWPKLLAFILAVCFLYSVLNSFGLIHRWTDGKWGRPRSAQGLSLKSLLPTTGTNAPAQAP